MTNLFDVADPDTELPRCSDTLWRGETHRLSLLLLLLLLFFFLPPLLSGRDPVSVRAGGDAAILGLRRTAGCLASEPLWHRVTHTDRHTDRPPCGCYSNRRSGRLLLPPAFLSDSVQHRDILSVRIAPNPRPGSNSAGPISVRVSLMRTSSCLFVFFLTKFVAGCSTAGAFILRFNCRGEARTQGGLVHSR